MHQIPIQTPSVPMLHNALRGQIGHPAQRIVFGKDGRILRDLPELELQALNDVRRVYDLPHLRRVFIKRAQYIPVLIPAFHARGVLLPLLLRKLKQVLLRLFQGHGGVEPQICGHLLDILPTDEMGGGTDLVDDAALETVAWIHCPNGLHHATEAVYAE